MTVDAGLSLVLVAASAVTLGVVLTEAFVKAPLARLADMLESAVVSIDALFILVPFK